MMASAPALPNSAVLHITSATGGGSDRYVRDLAASALRPHYLLHAAAGTDVLEVVGAGRFAPLRDLTSAESDADAIARWLQSSNIGILHLHGVDQVCRARLDALQRARTLPYLVTLHDLQFINPRAFDATGMPEPDPDWIAELNATLQRAATVIAPSAFILDVALLCAPGIRAAIIPPGLRPATTSEVPSVPADFAAHAPRRIIAVVGALGPHKGSGLLPSLATALQDSDIGIVVIGYTDTHLARGWLAPGAIYVHGPYEEDAIAGWLKAYGVEAVLFPNRLPESFSYTLSEVWAAGLPVVVPGEGALGERVERGGGGWVLPAGFGGDEAAALLVWLTSPEGAAEVARVKSTIVPGDAQRIPTLEAMSRDTDALYARFGLPPSETEDAPAAGEAVNALLAANLDGVAFRKELIKLSGEVEIAKARLAEAQRWNESLERNATAWAAKLERDIASLRVEIEQLRTESHELASLKAICERWLPRFMRSHISKWVARARR